MYTIQALTLYERCHKFNSDEERAKVTNIDLIEMFCSLINGLNVKFFVSHVPAHNGWIHNHAADRLAN
jgi:ribonuclease HI